MSDMFGVLTEMKDKDPAELGLQAYLDGQLESENPFGKGTSGHMEWQLGWEMAMLKHSPGDIADKLIVCHEKTA